LEGYQRYQQAYQLALSTAYVWDAATGQQVAVLKGHTEEIHSANFSPDSTQIATCSDDNTARIWSVASGRELFSLVHTTRVSRVVFSPDRQRLVTATVPVDVKKELAFSTTIVTRAGTVETNCYYTMKTAVPGAASTIWLWDAATRRLIANLGSGILTWYPEFTADSQQLLLNLGGNSVQTFDARTGQALRVLKGHSGIINQDVFFPDGRRVLTGSADGTAKLWDTETGRELLSLPHSTEVTAIAVAPDGRRLLTGAADGTTILWSADDWKEARTITSK
jgi:WD40 repeat protein